jgi:hypothetical protein
MNPNRLTPPGTTVLSLLPEDPYSIVKLSAEMGLTTAYLTVQPMQAPVGSVFYLDNERVKAAEDERLFKALDDVARPSSDD